LNLKGHPIYDLRVNDLEKQGPATPELAWEELHAIAEAEVARLERLKATRYLPFSMIDRAEAPARAEFIAGPEGALRLRYEGAASRGLQQALNEFMKLRKARLAEAVEEPEATEPARCESCRCTARPPDPASTSKPAAAAPATARKSAGSGRSGGSQVVASQQPVPDPAGARNEPNGQAAETVGGVPKGLESGPWPPSQGS
jgi:hypothetical protein